MRKLLPYIVLFVALCLMAGCGGNKAQRLRQLEQLEAQNSADEPMLNDSLAEELADYFDRHGTANERMRAKYILGRTYYDIGELPRALETYYEAADCADTTAADCDFAKLSRIHAQSAQVYSEQIQPRSQLKELRLAEYYARRGNDTLMAIECFAQQANAYKLLNQYDSVILIKERASDSYIGIGKRTPASITLVTTVIPLLHNREVEKAKHYISQYETFSGLFDESGNIEKGREVYYYIKGEYYLAINKIDSAEYLYRKELRTGKDLNNQIAGCKGLQKVFERRKNSDSIAKYATIAYALNDSAYSLSEMQNIQKFQTSYNYNHHKQLAEKSKIEAQKVWNLLLIMFVVVLLIVLLLLYKFLQYKAKRDGELKDYQYNQEALEKAQTDLLMLREENDNISDLITKKSKEIECLQKTLERTYTHFFEKNVADLETRLDESEIRKTLNNLLKANPPQIATQDNFRQLKVFINKEIPSFYSSLNTKEPLRPIEYEVCLLIRCHFKPAEICKLTDRSDSYIANIRKSVLLKVYGIKGVPKDLDERILLIK